MQQVAHILGYIFCFDLLSISKYEEKFMTGCMEWILFIYVTVCRSSANGIAHTHGESAEMRYETYRRIYTNCTYINGNLIINFLDGRDDYDMSFLKDIQEVTGYVMLLGNHFSYPGLTNLRVIRGRSVFTPGPGIGSGNDYSLFIASNYKENSATVGLKELRFVSLHGEILFNVLNFFHHLRHILFFRD